MTTPPPEPTENGLLPARQPAVPSRGSGTVVSTVAVVIPTYQAGEHLEECLASLRASTLIPAAILVVDNGSTDSSVQRAQAAWPQVEFILNGANHGFGAACNRGIKVALDRGHDFVFLLNQDARVEPDTLRELMEFSDAHPRAAIVGPKTLSTTSGADGAPLLLYNGAWRRCLPLWQRIPGVHRSSRGTSDEPRQVDYVWGHGMLIRAEALRTLGAFDPQYFMYWEDIDLCYTYQRAGWEIWCDSRTFMWHHVPDSIRASNSESLRWQWKLDSSRRFHSKHFPPVLGYLLWCLSTLREVATLAVHGHGRALTHLVRNWVREVVRRPPGFSRERGEGEAEGGIRSA
jgi:GT2 family glycosyltransferase